MRPIRANRFKYPHPPIPLLGAAVSVIIGILLARYQFIPLAVFLGCMLICLLGVGVCLLYRKYVKDRPLLNQLIPVLLYLGFACVGAVRYQLVYSFYPQNHILTFCAADRPRLATLRGRIVTEPYIAKSRGAFADYDFLHEPRTIFVLECDSVLTHKGWRETTGLSQITIKQPALHLRLGQRVQLDCWLGLRRGPDNPGQFDRTDYNHAARNLVSASVSAADGITILSDAPKETGVISGLRRKIQSIARSALLEDIHLWSQDSSTQTDEEGFLSALLLGQRYQLSRYTYEAFMKTGTLHFLSVSGLHVGIVAGFVWWLGWIFRLRRGVHGLLILAVITAYLLLIPSRPPVLRAGIISIIFCIAFMSRRTVSPINILAFAALVILLWQPIDLFNAGFQLSFVVVLGLLLFAPSVYHRQISTDVFSTTGIPLINIPTPQLAWWQYLLRNIFRYLWGLFVVALVAWVVGLPLAAYHFHRIAPWGVLASVLLFPLIGLTMLVGIAKLLLTMLLPMLSGILMVPLAVLVQGVLGLIDLLGQLPYCSINTASPALWFIFLFYLVLIGAGWSTWRHRMIPRSVVYALLIWGLAWVWMIPFKPETQKECTTTLSVLDVGHGVAAVVELPDGKTILYDMGSISNFDLATQVVVPFLRYRGIQRVDAVFLSHPNLDHFDGVIDLCQSFNVTDIYVSDYFFNESSYTTGLLLKRLEEINHPLSEPYLHRGYKILGGDPNQPLYTLEVLWPPVPSEACQLSQNDSSLILHIQEKNGSILFCGDAGVIPQQFLLEEKTPEQLKSDVCLLPHHGSPKSMLPCFVDAVDPEICLNSSGSLPNTTLEKLDKLLSDHKVIHTCQRGCIMVHLGPSGMKVETFR